MEELNTPKPESKVVLIVNDDERHELSMEVMKLFAGLGEQYEESAGKEGWKEVDLRKLGDRFDPYLIRKMIQLAEKMVEVGPENIVKQYDLLKLRPGQEQDDARRVSPEAEAFYAEWKKDIRPRDFKTLANPIARYFGFKELSQLSMRLFAQDLTEMSAEEAAEELQVTSEKLQEIGVEISEEKKNTRNFPQKSDWKPRQRSD